ncbi:MAG: extracellular solute-binding protein [Clostridiales bacterium]|nr:extracellular solute-binding protein [Clostridiales bacterium]
MKLKRFASFSLVVALVFTITACKSNTGTNNNSGSGNTSKSALRIFMMGGAQWDGVSEDRVWTAIEEATKTDIHYEGTDSDYYETLNPMINTGDFPDIFFAVPGSTSGAYDKWAQQNDDGILYNIDLLLAQYPGEFEWLEKLYQTDQFKYLQWDNAHTLVPWLTSDYVYGIYYRKDWLINVGEVNADGSAKVPVTLEDFERVVKKFTENDPDKNGKKDTYGLSPNSDPFCWNQLYHAFGVCEDWDMSSDGNVTYMYTDEKFRKFLQWANKLYKNGWIDPSFNTNINVRDRDVFKDGKAGILMTDVEQHVKWVVTEFEEKQGKDLVVMGAPLVGTKNLGIEGAGGSSTRGGWYGGFSITKACKDPKAALRYLNYLISPEGSKMFRYGMEGTHYTVDGKGNIKVNNDERAKEPGGRFENSKEEDGLSHPNGNYCIGSTQIGGEVDWSKFDTEKKITVKADAGVLDYHFKNLIQQAQEKFIAYKDNILSSIIFPSSISAKEVKIRDIAKTYINPAIMGKINLTSDWNAMLKNCEKNGISDVKAVIHDTVIELGLIK